MIPPSIEQDCICAPATVIGGALSVVRLSGKGAQALVTHFFTPKQARFPLKDRQVYFGEIAVEGGIIDEVLLWQFSAPHSYTGEEMVEISCHGSIYIQQQLITWLIDNGCRLATPGEFTQRAFLNGKMDLSQAEAVADLIAASSESTHKLAISQLRGGYAQELQTLRAEFVRLISLMELELDFSEEDVTFANREQLAEMVSNLLKKVKQLTSSFYMGNALKQGIPVAIVGKPNTGKSTLLNTLLAEDRAIVSPIPGTTRDTIEAGMTLDGICFRFIDTAGLRETDDPIESMGFARSIKAAQEAKIILYVRDITTPYNQTSLDDIAHVTNQCDMQGKHLFVLHNRCDLPHEQTPPGLIISAKEGTGITRLKQQMTTVIQSDLQPTEGILITNIRHYEALCRTRTALEALQKGMESGLTPDLLCIDAREAIYHLGNITGEVTNNEILSSIFSNFCIGK